MFGVGFVVGYLFDVGFFVGYEFVGVSSCFCVVVYEKLFVVEMGGEDVMLVDWYISYRFVMWCDGFVFMVIR